MAFELLRASTDSRARRGRVTTLHGVIETPVFMPVGTRGTVRTQTATQLDTLGAQIILGNTYHLLQRPGAEVLEQFGGLHRWMDWRGAILTDSGGFQIFSLDEHVQITEDGAMLRDRANAAKQLVTPERAIEMQRTIGSDIMMVLDQCIASTSSRAEAALAMERTHRWAARSLAAKQGSAQALFAIVQGACFHDLRRESALVLSSIDGFDGYAIGGLAVGESKAEREDITELTASLLPTDRPRYLMGVGTPLDVLEAVHRGVDMFDCILPTAWAQHAKAFTSHGKLDLRRGTYRLTDAPLDSACRCETCSRHSRSYLHHLIKSGEPLAWQLLATHNLTFYMTLMREIRAHIEADTWTAFYRDRRETLSRSDPEHPPVAQLRTKRPRTERGAFRVVTSTSGFASIQHLASGEVMHSVNHPDREAERVYVEQSQLIAEACRERRRLVVWDVGLGAAHNAMALVRALDAAADHGDVELVSFEKDLDALVLALANAKHFPHLRHRAPNELAARGAFERPGLRWRVCAGDFAATFSGEPAPGVIFYVPFSTKVDAPLWSLGTFTALHRHLTRATELFTYSASTAVRTSLLLAGFDVARGVPSGPKEETTIALHALPGTAHPLLGREWLERRGRSSRPFGADIAAERHTALEELVQGHPQFAASETATPPRPLQLQ